MNEERVRSLLLLVDRPVVPSSETRNRARAAMVEQLRQYGEVEPVPVFLEAETQQPRMARPGFRLSALVGVVASILLVVSAAALVRPGGVPETAPSNMTLSYLRSCVNFQEVTTIGGEPWFRVLAELEVATPVAYLNDLAEAVDRIAETATAIEARPQLSKAAQLARSIAVRSEIVELIEALDQAQVHLARTTGVGCLDSRPLAGSPP